MAKVQQEDRLRELLAPCLGSGEALRSVGWFRSGGLWDLVLGGPRALPIRPWAVGITDKRAVVAQLGRLNGKPLPDRTFSVGLRDLVVKWGTLRITTPEWKARKAPRLLRFPIFADFDKDEFKRALEDAHR